jgi:hypothetical protein
MEDGGGERARKKAPGKAGVVKKFRQVCVLQWQKMLKHYESPVCVHRFSFQTQNRVSPDLYRVWHITRAFVKCASIASICHVEMTLEVEFTPFGAASPCSYQVSRPKWDT